MPHPSLQSTDHRPWPLPQRAWSLTMCWEELLFLHWEVDPDALRRALPPGVELDTFDRRAWLGVVPFRMSRTRFRWWPRLPTAHVFPELNVRTYVHAGGRPGVWFFSLDAASRLAVEGARWAFGLPYFAARMACERRGDHLHYRSERRDRRGPAARFAADWNATGAAEVAAARSLEHFVTERYCLFAQRRGRIVQGEIAHPPWQLARADVRIESCDMTQLLGIQLAGPPASALVASPQTVAAWSPLPAGSG